MGYELLHLQNSLLNIILMYPQLFGDVVLEDLLKEADKLTHIYTNISIVYIIDKKKRHEKHIFKWMKKLRLKRE